MIFKISRDIKFSNFYIKMNKDEEKFQKFLDKQKEDAEHKQEKRKRS